MRTEDQKKSKASEKDARRLVKLERRLETEEAKLRKLDEREVD